MAKSSSFANYFKSLDSLGDDKKLTIGRSETF